jgi:RNA polymerase sigma factor (sigma-70 family)
MYSHLKRWTDAHHVTDEELITQYDRWILKQIWQQCKKAGFKASRDDIDDIAQSVRLKLLEVPQDRRPYCAYMGKTILFLVKRFIIELSSRGGTPKYRNGYMSTEFQTMNIADIPAEGEETTDEYKLGMVAETACHGVAVDASLDVAALMTKAKLSDRDRQIVLLRFQGYTLEELSDQFGLTRQRIQQVEHNALRKLRYHAAKTLVSRPKG